MEHPWPVVGYRSSFDGMHGKYRGAVLCCVLHHNSWQSSTRRVIRLRQTPAGRWENWFLQKCHIRKRGTELRLEWSVSSKRSLCSLLEDFCVNMHCPSHLFGNYKMLKNVNLEANGSLHLLPQTAAFSSIYAVTKRSLLP